MYNMTVKVVDRSGTKRGQRPYRSGGDATPARLALPGGRRAPFVFNIRYFVSIQLNMKIYIDTAPPPYRVLALDIRQADRRRFLSSRPERSSDTAAQSTSASAGAPGARGAVTAGAARAGAAAGGSSRGTGRPRARRPRAGAPAAARPRAPRAPRARAAPPPPRAPRPRRSAGGTRVNTYTSENNITSYLPHRPATDAYIYTRYIHGDTPVFPRGADHTDSCVSRPLLIKFGVER